MRVQIRIPSGIDIQATLIDCGQAFQYENCGGGIVGASGGRAALFTCKDDVVEILSDGPGDPAFWAHYFDVLRDYGALMAQYAHIPMLAHALGRYRGLRVLNQPAWETVVGFVLSANNNVSRIRSLVAKLRREIGPVYEVSGNVVYGYPQPEAILRAGEGRLRELGCGYRAPFLAGTARAVAEGFDLSALSAMPYEQAHRSLLSLPGVGPKVADCILLFGAGHARAVPVDIWIERVLRQAFGYQGSKKELKEKAYAEMGEDVGIVQQYMFHAARMGELAVWIG